MADAGSTAELGGKSRAPSRRHRPRTASPGGWHVLRRHLIVASWYGHGLFIVYGMFAGFYYGGFGGVQFFSDMFLLDYLGKLPTLLGAVCGVFIGLVCVWAICVVAAAAVGVLVYWVRYRSLPLPPQ